MQAHSAVLGSPFNLVIARWLNDFLLHVQYVEYSGIASLISNGKIYGMSLLSFYIRDNLQKQRN